MDKTAESEATQKFAALAREFCAWAESITHDAESARDYLLRLMQMAPPLHAAEDTSASDIEYPLRSHEQCQLDHKRFSDLPFQYYRDCFSPLDLEEESSIGDLCDDFADIYADLWHGLQASDAGDMQYAVNYWREMYLVHWGAHAASAFRALDSWYRAEKLKGQKTDKPTPSASA